MATVTQREWTVEVRSCLEFRVHAAYQRGKEPPKGGTPNIAVPGSTGRWPVVRGSLPRTLRTASGSSKRWKTAEAVRIYRDCWVFGVPRLRGLPAWKEPPKGGTPNIAACAPHKQIRRSKCETETEMKRAEIFEFVRVRIYPVVETNRADGQFVTQTGTDGVSHIAQPDVL